MRDLVDDILTHKLVMHFERAIWNPETVIFSFISADLHIGLMGEGCSIETAHACRLLDQW